ncbi:DUF1361 domain-containing protein [Chitinophaga pendula]|uniref:DUF1361 domain-containing protein n=1 Tax=Chitinophaga TaxID=79328 RepID=UPI000BAEA0E7|nr:MULTISPECIES: DUF1361 domain-containing protein [Chitinophaga]ASZ10025.1 hypothetical protein CK934_03045 [Chitinophaga sp. MD30]UCJ07027.1 DUF1361 domain-containing protein [Chitinophaga pendula]
MKSLQTNLLLIERRIRRGDTMPVLLLSIGFSLVLLLARIGITGTMQYSGLLWNLFLAWVPYGITSWMQRFEHYKSRNGFKTLRIVAVIWWMLFLPNAPYILTDLYHLPQGGAPMWFDLFLILSFAWNGLWLGYLSLRYMEQRWTDRYPDKPLLLFTFPVLILCGLGVYVGRYLRWNTWDVLTDPFMIIRTLSDIIFHPIQNIDVWAFSCCMAVFMTIIRLVISARKA